jgi:hypothetical protein
LLNVELTAKWAFDLQLDFECGPGSEEYKSYWSRGNRGYCSTTVSINSSWGLAAFYVRRLLRNLAKRASTPRQDVDSPRPDTAGEPENSPGV